jgi:atypical dual specificity phosphatase
MRTRAFLFLLAAAVGALTVNKYPRGRDNTAQCIGRVCIGGEFAATNKPHLIELGITHIVTAIGTPERAFEHIDYLVLEFDDHRSVDIAPWLDMSSPWIADALASRPDARVLVHCAAGISRSASIVIDHLMRANGWDFDEALAQLRAVRPVVNPNAGFVGVLRARRPPPQGKE